MKRSTLFSAITKYGRKDTCISEERAFFAPRYEKHFSDEDNQGKDEVGGNIQQRIKSFQDHHLLQQVRFSSPAAFSMEGRGSGIEI